MDALTFQDVTFGYRRADPPVISELTWRVPSGRTVLLGPNGAGKTTLLALGANVLTPETGSVRLGSVDARSARRAFRRVTGWMPQVTRAVPGLTALEQVAYAGWLKGLSRSEAWRAAHDALKIVQLNERGATQTSQFSGGQLRRVGLAQAIVHRPRVLLLDEPTSGLDPAQRARFRDLVRGLSSDSYQVVVSTHQVDDLSDVFETVTVLERGVIRHESAVSEFIALGAGAERPAEAAYAAVVAGEV